MHPLLILCQAGAEQNLLKENAPCPLVNGLFADRL